MQFREEYREVYADLNLGFRFHLHEADQAQEHRL